MMERAPELSVVIPAYNEEKRLGRGLERLRQYFEQECVLPGGVEILVVDDGSTDGTVRVAQEWAARIPYIRLLSNGQNRGKGYSVRHGMLEARGRVALFTDADLSSPIEESKKLLAAIQTGNDVAIGSRAMDRSLIFVHQSRLREIAGIIFNAFVRLFTGLRLQDTQCGFKAFRTPVARLLFHLMVVDRFAFDVEILYLAQQLGMQISEVPVQWRESENSKVRPLSDSVSMVLDVLRLRFRKSLPPIPALVVTPDSSKRGSRRPPALTRAFSAFRQTDPLLPLARGRALLLLPLCTPTEVDGTALRIGKSSSNVMVRKRLISGTELMDMMPLSWSTGVSGQTDDVRDVGSPFPERRGTNGITHRVGNILRVDQEPVCSLEI